MGLKQLLARLAGALKAQRRGIREKFISPVTRSSDLVFDFNVDFELGSPIKIALFSPTFPITKASSYPPTDTVPGPYWKVGWGGGGVPPDDRH